MKIEAVLGDITTQDVDAIVNAANSSLLGGGGVDGAIHAAAGPRLLEACRRVRRTEYPDGLPVGDAVATPGFDLPARWVVHTVGPNWNRGQRETADLASCFTRSLERAVEVGATSIAFPAVSAGAYGWDADEVARIGVAAARAWQGSTERPDEDGHTHPSGIALVRFVLFSPPLLDAFERALGAPHR
ncbi:O-acetyl-ADP-ribose deacetylase [Cellulomonas septica]|uniref:O-acetyl-ADP-ribose deacetylase n=1 Tax=Cellulomonas septica TaxID=285080 RepID=A0ABX1JX98_9CELL|nr:O-acetyl-ADP-ribose deacetylase [Cellulomonas septica]NKY38672.1 O-acetyl-ADP-ribose deacetylase [Cellulomonas septica]